MLGRLAIVLGICALIASYVLQQRKDTQPFPICDEASRSEYRAQLLQYADINTSSGAAGYKELKGECAFNKYYESARTKFLEAAKAIPGVVMTKYPIGNEGLTIDVAEVPGSKENYMVSVSGVHGPEGFAGSAIQNSLLQLLADSPRMRELYNFDGSKKAEGGEEPAASKAPTLIFVHALNPFGFAKNRRFNEDNIDVNRNFLTEEAIDLARRRYPNFAGYGDIDFLINPRSMPFGSITPLNDIFSHLKSAYAVAQFGIEFIKRALVAGNYFKRSGLGFGGFTRSKSVLALIDIAATKELHKAKKITLLDHHTGLGPSGTDTLASLGHRGDNPEKEALIDSMFPKEMDGDVIVGGDKASTAAGSAMSGYELTIGTMDHFCKTWMAPDADHSKDVLCITQEFGTVPVIEVGKAQIEENFAYHYGTKEQKQIYGERLKGVFYVQTATWMRNVAHRGVTLWMQAFNIMLAGMNEGK